MSVLVIIALLYVVACTLLFLKQRSLLYFPTSRSIVAGATEISLEVEGETLSIWTRPSNGRKAIIYFGGNSEDVGFSFARFADAFPDHALYLVNYRGYGGSTGSPSENALFADSLAIYDLVQAKHPRISVIGRSLGSGVAVYLSSTRKVERLVLVTPYDSIENVAKTHFPIFPISILITDKFESNHRVKSITAENSLVILAENDEVIPRANSDALIREFDKGQLVTRVLGGSTHNSIDSSSEYLGLVSKFLTGDLDPTLNHQ